MRPIERSGKNLIFLGSKFAVGSGEGARWATAELPTAPNHSGLQTSPRRSFPQRGIVAASRLPPEEVPIARNRSRLQDNPWWVGSDPTTSRSIGGGAETESRGHGGGAAVLQPGTSLASNKALRREKRRIGHR
jgi:hypothetical protein